jgi:hypothetical protein
VILAILMMEAIRSSEATVLTRATRRHNSEYGILYSHRRKNLKSYTALNGWALWWRWNVSPVRYELGFHIPEDGILHSHRRENLRSYITLTAWTLLRRINVSLARYELGFYIPEDSLLHSHRRENIISCNNSTTPHFVAQY